EIAAIKAAKAEVAKARRAAADLLAKAQNQTELNAATAAIKFAALKANALKALTQDELEAKAAKSVDRLEAKAEALTAEAAKDSDARLLELQLEREITANKAAEAHEYRLAEEAKAK